MRKSFKVLIASLLLGTLSCSVQQITVEDDSSTNNETMPRTQDWSYYGKQSHNDNNQCLYLQLDFHQGIHSWVQYGSSFDDQISYERKKTLWKMIDSTVFIYLEEDKTLYMMGKILEGDQLDVWWDNSLGIIWDSKHEENEWESNMTLDLTRILDDVLGRDSVWSPWNTPGYGENYGNTVP